MNRNDDNPQNQNPASGVDGFHQLSAPGFAARWRQLAARVQVIDHRGRGLALSGAGDLARGLTITAATGFAGAPDDALGPVAVDAPEAIGRTITHADVLAAADHRGDG